MTIRATHTYVELEAPPALYDFVVGKMIEAEYGHVFDGGVTPEAGKDCGPIDMHGLALTRGAADEQGDACSRELAAARVEIASLKASAIYYIREAERAAEQCQEQRERRLALEEELPFVNMPSGPVAYRALHPETIVTRIVYRPIESGARCGLFARIGHRLDLLLGNS
jgi:hypothetical protein